MVLAEDKKLTVIFRVEPGCLGPEGLSHVDKFCIQALLQLQRIHPEFLKWQVVPRHDKSLAEMDFAINGKVLSRDQAKRYLEYLKQDIDAFEMNVFDRIPELIDQYFGR